MSLQGKTIVLLRTSSVARIPVYQQLRRDGVRIIMVHPIFNEQFEKCFDHWIVHDTNDVNLLETALNKELERLDIVPDAILSFDEYGVYPAACLAVRRGMRPIPFDPEAQQSTTVKSAFRRFCAAHGISAPRSVPILQPTDDVAELVKGIEFPVVIKPSPGGGSLLTKYCASLGELQRHAQYMWGVLNNHPDAKHLSALGTPVHLLVEEYVGGQEVDIDCAIENGVIRFVAISDNFPTQPPYFTEVGGCCPTRLGSEEQSDLLQLLSSFVSAHGSSCHGVLHFEAKYDFERKKSFVIEVNCRMGSAETFTMITNSYEVNLGECLVRLGLGLPLSNLRDDSQTVKRHSASVNIYPSSEGVLREVSAPVGDGSLVAYSISAKAGALVALPPKSFFLLAWMVATGSTSDEAIGHIKRLTEEFKQEVSSAQ